MVLHTFLYPRLKADRSYCEFHEPSLVHSRYFTQATYGSKFRVVLLRQGSTKGYRDQFALLINSLLGWEGTDLYPFQDYLRESEYYKTCLECELGPLISSFELLSIM